MGGGASAAKGVRPGSPCPSDSSDEHTRSTNSNVVALRDTGDYSAAPTKQTPLQATIASAKQGVTKRCIAVKEYRRSNATKREDATKFLCKSAIRGAEGMADCEDQVHSAFKEWDVDGTGRITRDELAAVLEAICKDGGISMPKGSIDVLLKEAATDHDQGISYEEMVDWLFCAPNLEKYFVSSEAIQKKNLLEAKKIAAECQYIAHHSNDQVEAHQRMVPVVEKFHKDCQDRIDKELTPLIKKAYAWHDKDGDGFLSYDESIIFFSNYASLLGPYLITAAELSATHQMNTPACQNPETVQKVLRLFAKKTKRRMQTYLNTRDERHRAAFAVLDVNGDGRLYEREIVEALLHGHQKNQELMNAFGLVVPREEIINEMTGPEGSLASREECNMQ